jgi:hypothetical protein
MRTSIAAGTGTGYCPYEARMALKDTGPVREYAGRWKVNA